MKRWAEDLLNNRLLADLPLEVRDRLNLREMDVQRQEGLLREGRPVEHVFFPIDCVLAIFTQDSQGRVLQTGMVGLEGALGLVEALGDGVASWTSEVLIAGRVLAVSAQACRDLGLQDLAFAAAAWKATQTQLVQAREFALCHTFHTAEARLARWLMELQARSGLAELPLSQHDLAEMLGLQRTTISQAAATLKFLGLIDYTRGRVRITRAEGLVARACPCRRNLLPENGRDTGIASSALALA